MFTCLFVCCLSSPWCCDAYGSTQCSKLNATKSSHFDNSTGHELSLRWGYLCMVEPSSLVAIGTGRGWRPPWMLRASWRYRRHSSSDVTKFFPGPLMQAIGSYGSGLMDIEELGQVERSCLPGSGSCGKLRNIHTSEGPSSCDLLTVKEFILCIAVFQVVCLRPTPCRLLWRPWGWLCPVSRFLSRHFGFKLRRLALRYCIGGCRNP